jgi:HAD superfamily hydrolase (TIGR01457 family)
VSVFIFDLDGVIYRGHDPIPGAPEAIAALRRRGHTVAFATNNSTHTRADVVAKLAAMGVPATLDEVIATSYATARYILGAGRPHRNLLLLGAPAMYQEVEAAGLPAVHDPPPPIDYVVVGLDSSFNYDRLAQAQAAVLAGAMLVATNRDPQLPIEGGHLLPGAGSLVVAVETATRRQAVSIGKPEPGLFAALLDALGASPAATIVVGDNLLTDIAAAARLGCRSVLVLTGVSSRADLATSEIKPDMVVETLDELVARVG